MKEINGHIGELHGVHVVVVKEPHCGLSDRDVQRVAIELINREM